MTDATKTRWENTPRPEPVQPVPPPPSPTQAEVNAAGAADVVEACRPTYADEPIPYHPTEADDRCPSGPELLAEIQSDNVRAWAEQTTADLAATRTTLAHQHERLTALEEHTHAEPEPPAGLLKALYEAAVIWRDTLDPSMVVREPVGGKRTAAPYGQNAILHALVAIEDAEPFRSEPTPLEPMGPEPVDNIPPPTEALKRHPTKPHPAGSCSSGYGEPTDSHLPDGLDSGEYIALALACIDQAGFRSDVQQMIIELLESYAP